VEDDAATRTVLRRSLEREGWTVAEAENGRIGLEQMETDPPSLVLLDLMMPEMDGFEFLDGLRARGISPAAPVVVITAKELTDQDRQRLNGGVARVLAKGPRSQEDLVSALKQLAAAGVRGEQ
jgi:CheY-like chemotaxis protein